jgi:hypothetical protein
LTRDRYERRRGGHYKAGLKPRRWYSNFVIRDKNFQDQQLGVKIMRHLASLTLAVGILISAPTYAVQAADCKPGRISCEDWCKKYREAQNQASCLRVNQRSCIKLYGGLDVCVPDNEARK